MKHVKVPHLDPTTRQKIILFALLLIAIAVWVICILLLLEVTRQLLDTLTFVVDLAQMS